MFKWQRNHLLTCDMALKDKTTTNIKLIYFVLTLPVLINLWMFLLYRAGREQETLEEFNQWAN